MNWISLLLLAALAWFTWRAYRNGLVRELVTLASVVFAIPIAGVLYDDMAPKVEPIVANGVLAALISFLAIMAGVVIAGYVAAFSLRQTVEMLNLGGVDRLAGGVFGFLKGMLLCQAILIALVMFPNPDLRSEIDRSPVARGLLETAPLALRILPDSFERRVSEFLEPSPAADEPSAGAIEPHAACTMVPCPWSRPSA